MVPVIARGNNCRRFAFSLWRSVDKRPVALPFITGRIKASHRDISVLMQLPGNTRCRSGEIVLSIADA